MWVAVASPKSGAVEAACGWVNGMQLGPPLSSVQKRLGPCPCDLVEAAPAKAQHSLSSVVAACALPDGGMATAFISLTAVYYLEATPTLKVVRLQQHCLLKHVSGTPAMPAAD